MRFWYDTEFLEDGKTIELISIGIVCENEATYYAVNSDMPVDRIVEDTWMKQNVWPHLPVRMNGDHPTIFLDMTSPTIKPKWVIANEVREFLTGIRNNDGIMHMMVVDIVEQLISQGSVRYLMYDTYFGAGQGLRMFKTMLGFQPYRAKYSIR